LKILSRLGLVCITVLLTSCTSSDSVDPLPSLINKLPKNLSVEEKFSDTTGMDGFLLLKAKYDSQTEVDEICTSFRLTPYGGGDPGGMAKIVAERMGIDWFPLSNVDKVFRFCSFNADGTWKEGVTGRYEHRLWVDKQNRLLIFQEAGM